MALTQEEFYALRKKGLSLDQIVGFEKGVKPPQPAQTAGNAFQEPAPETGGFGGFLGKARDFATSIIGGGKLAEGAGMALAAPGIQKSMSDAEQNLSNTDLALVKRINEKKQRGEDTTRLENARNQLLEDMKSSRDVSEDFIKALPSNREVIGSALRLGATLVAPTIGGKAAALSGVAKGVTGVGAGIARGAAAGAIGGAVEGGLQGLGTGIEQGGGVGDVALTTALGATGGALTGGVVGGAVGGFTGKLSQETKVLDAVTPQASELTPTQYKKLLAKGQITPKTGTQPAQVIISDAQKEVAMKYKDLLGTDPVRNSLNISDKIASLDEDVGSFLSQNNIKFNKDALKNSLIKGIGEVDDITVDSAKLADAKTKIVDRFMAKLKSNDVHSLWEARKEFDQSIEKAFSGAPNVQKDMKIAFRNAAQDFISDYTDDTTYSGLMKEMSNLFRLRDNIGIKAAKQRGYSAVGLWIKNHPKTANIVGWGSAGAAATAVGSKILGGITGKSGTD
jgi:hypothetical protein